MFVEVVSRIEACRRRDAHDSDIVSNSVTQPGITQVKVSAVNQDTNQLQLVILTFIIATNQLNLRFNCGLDAVQIGYPYPHAFEEPFIEPPLLCSGQTAIKELTWEEVGISLFAKSDFAFEDEEISQIRNNHRIN